MTDPELRAYFAAHAPAEIPKWFSFPRKEYIGPPMPKVEDYPEEKRERIVRWLSQWYSNKWVSDWQGIEDFCKAARVSDSAWQPYDRDCLRERYIAWRWAYADAMMAAR